MPSALQVNLNPLSLEHMDNEHSFQELQRAGVVQLDETFQNFHHRIASISNSYLVNCAPATRQMQKRLIEPLVTARQSFAFGGCHFLAAIELSETAVEMASIFICDVVVDACNLDALPDALRSFLVSNRYESCTQSERLDRLKDLKLLSSDYIDDADRVRVIRNPYRHVLDKSHARIEQDAQEAIVRSMAALDRIVGLHPSNEVRGALELPPILREYCKHNGLISGN